MNLKLLIMLVISDQYFGWLIIASLDRLHLLAGARCDICDEELLLCVCLLEFACYAISVPEYAKSAFWMQVVLILNINII